MHSEYFFSSICNTFVGKYLDGFFQSSQLGNLNTTVMVNIILIFLGQIIKVNNEKMSLDTSKMYKSLEHYSVSLLSLADYYLPYH